MVYSYRQIFLCEFYTKDLNGESFFHSRLKQRFLSFREVSVGFGTHSSPQYSMQSCTVDDSKVQSGARVPP